MLLLDPKDLKDADYLAGITILVDKPLEWTSFDVVNKIRYALRRKLKVKKIKVGHAGTLDPLATGLLIIAIGKDTKKINDYQEMEKVYSGTMCLGATTESYDAEYAPNEFFSTDHITFDKLEIARKTFLGKIEQVPPNFSALKVKGESAYKLARKGVDFKLKKRTIEIFEFEIMNHIENNLDFKVRCQKGTYIRSLINDFGKKLDSGAYLSSLRREKIGQFDVSNAFDLEKLIIELN